MNEYFVDRETLGQFVDALAEKSGRPIDTNTREDLMHKLDDRVLDNIFRGMPKNKLDEISGILDRNEEDPDVFDRFFKSAGVNIEAAIIKSFKTFEAEYLGGARE